MSPCRLQNQKNLRRHPLAARSAASKVSTAPAPAGLGKEVGSSPARLVEGIRDFNKGWSGRSRKIHSHQRVLCFQKLNSETSIQSIC